MDGGGKRFNAGKLRYDLIPAFAQEQYAKVLTFGAKKYGENNWRRGMKYSNVISSACRHLEAIKRGEDHDPETGVLHSAHLMCNAAFLTEYYKIYPQGDDRPHSYNASPKIGLDIDEVLADFVSGYCEKYGIQKSPEMWNFDPLIKQRIEELKKDKYFWTSLKPLIDPADIPFEPHCYITSRPCCGKWTEEWLLKHGFPIRPIHTVGYNKSKVEVALEAGIDWFVDDRWENFVALNNAGICTFLWNAPHNQRFKAGFKRINKLSDIYWFG